jgi:hypothetical protein
MMNLILWVRWGLSAGSAFAAPAGESYRGLENNGRPILECRMHVFTRVTAQSWGDAEEVTVPGIDASTVGIPRIADVEGFARVGMSRKRNAQRRWQTTFPVTPARGTRLYEVPVTDPTGRCPTTGERALGPRERLSYTLIDDQSGENAPPKLITLCFISEKKSNGQRVAFRLACKQTHNPEEDEMQRDFQVQRASSGSRSQGGRSGGGR